MILVYQARFLRERRPLVWIEVDEKLYHIYKYRKDMEVRILKVIHENEVTK